MFRGVIFDLDGTLGDTLPVCYRSFARVLGRRLGRQFGDSEIHSMFGPSEEGILERLFPEDPQGALAEYLAEYRRAHASCPTPFHGIRECLESLRARGARLAVVTGKGPQSAAISLERFRLAEFFRPVEAGSPSGGVKPAAIRRVLDQWGLDPSEVAGVGDSASDIRSAKEAGIASAGAAWAPGADARRLAACGPDQLFFEVAALGQWLGCPARLTR